MNNRWKVTIGVGLAGLAALWFTGKLTPPVLNAEPPPVKAAGEPKPAERELAYQPPKDAKADAEAIRKAGDAYTAALNKGDLEAIMALFAADAEYINDQGKTTRGKNAIAALFKEGFAKTKGLKFETKSDSIRVIKADVAVEDGTLRTTNAQGQADTSRYMAVWVKQDGKWLISSARDLPIEDEPAKDPILGYLKELEWLVGEWTDKDKGTDISIQYKWAPRHSYILGEFTIKNKEGEELNISHRIGYDPLVGEVRSWIFDTRGGFAEGYWGREGNTWSMDVIGYTFEGRIGSARLSFKYIDDDNFVYKSTNREIDGRPIADSEIKLTRKAK